MVGQGVLRECLLAADVERILTVGRTKLGVRDPKLTDLVQPDLFDYGAVEAHLQGFDGCFFCLGVSSAGMAADRYERITYDLPLAAATTLARLNPGMVFTYVTGAGTDSTERGRSRWARVKGRTENALQRLPFRGVYLFRPGVIQPLHGVQPRNVPLRLLYAVLKPFLGVARSMAPNFVLTTETVGQAMLNAVRYGAPKAVLETADINALASARQR